MTLAKGRVVEIYNKDTAMPRKASEISRLAQGMGSMVLLFFLSRGLTSISVFFLTRFLSLDSFGNVVLSRNLIDLIYVLFNIGIPFAFVRFFSECRDDPKRLYVTTVIPVCILNLIGAACIVFVHGWFSRVFHLDAEFRQCMICVAFIAVFQTFSQLVLLDFQARENFKGYVVGQTVVTVGTLLPMVLAGWFFKTAASAIAGLLCGYLLTAIPFVGPIRSHIGGLHHFDLALLKRMLRFGVPLLLTNVSYLAVSFSDRFVIQFFRGIRDVGIYAVPGYICAVMTMMFTTPVTSALAPQVYRLHQEKRNDEVEKLIRGIFRSYLVVLPVALFVIVAGAPFLAHLLGKQELMQGLHVLPWIGPACALFILYSVSNIVLSVHHRTRILGFAFMVACVANIGLNLYLVPRIGYMGAAYSSLSAYSIIFVITHTAASRYCRLDQRVWIAVPLWIALLLVETRLTTAHNHIGGSVLVAASITAIYLIVAIALRIFRVSDIQFIRSVMARRGPSQIEVDEMAVIENA